MKLRAIGLTLMALFLTSMALASAAPAAEYIYKVEGKELKTGETKEIKSSMKSANFTIKGKGALNVESVVKCTGLKLNAAEKPVIVGGKPGKSELEILEVSGCTATVGGAICTSVTVTYTKWINETVVILAPAWLRGRLATLYTPVGGVAFTVNFKSCGIFGSPSAKITGSSAGLAEPNGKEEVKDWLVFSAGESEITEVEKSNKETKKVELTNEEKKKVTVEGEAWVELASGQKWGVF